MLLKLSKFFLYASVFSVLVVMNQTFFPFIGGKDYFFRTAIELSLIFFLLWWASGAPAGEVSARLKNLFSQPLFLAVSLFALMFTLATIFAYDPHAAFWSNYERGEGGFQVLHYYAFFFLSVYLFREKKDWTRLFWVSIAAAVGMILYGAGAAVFNVDPATGALSNPFGFIGPYAEGGKLISPTFLGRVFSNGARFQGSLGNPAYVAPYLMFSLFYLIWLWVSENKRTLLINISYGVLGVFLVIFFLASQTRGAFVGLVAALFVFLAVLVLKNRVWRKRLIVLLAVLAVLLGTLMYYGRRDFVKKLPAGRLFDIGFSDRTFQTRLWTWNSAWQGFKERPLLGWGPENFSPVFDKYFDPRHFIPGQPSETWFDYAHSIIFDYLVEIGILGFLSYLLIFALFFRELVKKFEARSNVFLTALLAALPIGYLIQGLALFNILAIYINIFLFLAFACYQFYPPSSDTPRLGLWRRVFTKK